MNRYDEDIMNRYDMDMMNRYDMDVMKIDIDGNDEYIDGYNEEIDIDRYDLLSFYFPLYLFLPINSTL